MSLKTINFSVMLFFGGGIGKGDCSECVHVTCVAGGGGCLLPMN